MNLLVGCLGVVLALVGEGAGWLAKGKAIHPDVWFALGFFALFPLIAPKVVWAMLDEFKERMKEQ
jgi:hypothetical protein